MEAQRHLGNHISYSTPQKWTAGSWKMISLLQGKSFEPNHLPRLTGFKICIFTGCIFCFMWLISFKGLLVVPVFFLPWCWFHHFPYFPAPSKLEKTLRRWLSIRSAIEEWQNIGKWHAGCERMWSWDVLLALRMQPTHPLKKQGCINRYDSCWWINTNFMVMVLLRDCLLRMHIFWLVVRWSLFSRVEWYLVYCTLRFPWVSTSKILRYDPSSCKSLWFYELFVWVFARQELGDRNLIEPHKVDPPTIVINGVVTPIRISAIYRGPITPYHCCLKHHPRTGKWFYVFSKCPFYGLLILTTY